MPSQDRSAGWVRLVEVGLMTPLEAHSSETHPLWFQGPELMGGSSQNPQSPLGCTVPVQAVGPRAWSPPRGFQDTGPPLRTIGRRPDTSDQQTGQALSGSALNGAVPGTGLGPSVPYFPLFPKSQSNMNLPRVCVSKAVTLVREKEVNAVYALGRFITDPICQSFHDFHPQLLQF